MRNIKMSRDGNILIIEMDLSEHGRVSGSGKSMSLASTEGNVEIEPGSRERIGVNLYRVIPYEERKKK